MNTGVASQTLSSWNLRRKSEQSERSRIKECRVDRSDVIKERHRMPGQIALERSDAIKNAAIYYVKARSRAQSGSKPTEHISVPSEEDWHEPQLSATARQGNHRLQTSSPVLHSYELNQTLVFWRPTWFWPIGLMWYHPQNRKYLTYRNVVKDEPSLATAHR